MFVAATGGIFYYPGEFIKADARLLELRREIRRRPGLVRRRLAVRDCLEVLTTGMSVGLAICGAVEIADLAFGVNSAGTR